MTNWFDRVFPANKPSKQDGAGQNALVPGPAMQELWTSFLPPVPQQRGKEGQLPNASLIYGVAAAAIFGVGLYFLFTGMWLTGLFTMIPGLALLGYALHFLRYPV